MKKLTTLLFALSLFLMVEAQEPAVAETGIQFEQLDWENTLKMAKEQEKIIFVDAYTTWCGPCKWMDKNVYPAEAVGAYFNENFVNVKIDMEKGEGILFAKAYNVRAFPSYLFIDGNGKLVHRGVGSQPAEKFIGLAEAASDEDNRLGTQIDKFDQGERDPAFLKSYATVLRDVYMLDDQARIVDLYLKTQEDWLSSENAEFIVDMVSTDLNNELFQYMAAHRKELGDAVGQEKVDAKIKRAAMSALYREHRDELDNKEVVVGTFMKVFPKAAAEQYGSEFIVTQMSRAQEPEGQQKFVDAAVKHMDQYKSSDWGTLNTLAWRVYELSDDPAILEKAKDWAAKSVELDSNYMNNDTLAALYLKLKNKEKALQYAHEAIELAKESGANYDSTEKMLEQIEALQ